MQRLTKAEEQVMLILWERGELFVKEILEVLPEPRPAYNTVSTIIRILEQKEFVGHEAFGRSHRYHPLVSADAYRKWELEKLKKDHFQDSAKALVSFFLEKEELDIKDLDEILQTLKKKKK